MSSNREISNTEIMGFVNNDVDALPIGDKAKTIERLERAERIWKAISERAISLFDNHDDVDCDTDALYSVITDTEVSLEQLIAEEAEKSEYDARATRLADAWVDHYKALGVELDPTQLMAVSFRDPKTNKLSYNLVYGLDEGLRLTGDYSGIFYHARPSEHRRCVTSWDSKFIFTDPDTGRLLDIRDGLTRELFTEMVKKGLVQPGRVLLTGESGTVSVRDYYPYAVLNDNGSSIHFDIDGVTSIQKNHEYFKMIPAIQLKV